jgi:hypothetical protein
MGVVREKIWAREVNGKGIGDKTAGAISRKQWGRRKRLPHLRRGLAFDGDSR